METQNKTLTTSKDAKYSFFKNDENQGTWKLEYLIDADQVEKFSLTTLAPYEHPLSGQKYFPSQNNQPLTHLVVDKIITHFHPDRDKSHQRILDWLISNPEVQVDGLKLDQKYLNNKVKARFTLVNLNMQDLTQMEEENIIDEMVGRLSFSGGPNSIGIKKLRYASAEVGLAYIDRRHSKNPNSEKLHLRNKLKHYVRKGKKQALEFKQIISNVENAERMFALKVLLDKKEIIYEHGIYKYNGRLLGSSLESAVGFLMSAPDIGVEMIDKAHNYLKEEGFKI